VENFFLLVAPFGGQCLGPLRGMPQRAEIALFFFALSQASRYFPKAPVLRTWDPATSSRRRGGRPWWDPT